MSHTKLLPAEQETVILWDNELDTAQISTCDSRLIAKLEALACKYPEQFRRERVQPRRQNQPARSEKAEMSGQEGQPEPPRFYRVLKRLVTVRAPYNEARRQEQIRQAAESGTIFVKGKESDVNAN